ncbi:Helix-turn-helix domain-containing protein [Amycolatopsis arida]|uniref:Helix-turn-helix domain-containing protein n=1 Tax=Amycolatopsis arida TaxID=587909 RepID=A0A1I5THR7_9PSEU|nr:helix-turn-helix transcriptional regulator [Amycolatopsis arida]TDX96087.1 helix-turn-helix protein [Amycolatopsis arida]SFP82622.1 Helix-turn-helix domain-containing protein [Amycolatopsis arida]
MSGTDPGPVVQRILLGAELRDAREAAGLSTADATKALGWYAGKLSKIEQGDAKVTDKDLAKAIKVYGIVDDRAGRLRELAVEARRRLPPARVPDWAVKYVNLLAAAHEVKIFNIDVIPGTLQTYDYAYALLAEAVMFSPAELDRMAEERAARAERFLSGEARLWLVLDEAALYRQIGGPKVLRKQLERVKELAARPNITVQVIPFDGGAHASHGVAFTIVNLFEGRPGIVYVESLTGSDYLGREHTRAYNLAYDKLRVAALSERQTIDLVVRRIAEL